jgi:hypothetical protein
VALRVKSASRPFGVEQVRLLTRSTTTSEGRSYADPAEGYEPVGRPSQSGSCCGVTIASLVGSRGWRSQGGACGVTSARPVGSRGWRSQGGACGVTSARRVVLRVRRASGSCCGVTVGRAGRVAGTIVRPGRFGCWRQRGVVGAYPTPSGKRLPRRVGVVRGGCVCVTVRVGCRAGCARCVGGEGAVARGEMGVPGGFRGRLPEFGAGGVMLHATGTKTRQRPTR